MHRPDAERYSCGTFLCEQSVLVGSPDRWVDDWKLVDRKLSTTTEAAEVTLNLVSEAEPIECDITYSVPSGEGAAFKTIAVRNVGERPIVLLEANIECLGGDFESTMGGLGESCHVNGELFAGVRHPSGVARGCDRSVTLGTFPGKQLEPGQSYTSKTAVIGVGGTGQAGRAFTNHVERHGHRRRELLNMSHCYGIHDVAGMEEPTDLTEQMLLSNLDDIAQLRRMGVEFDYYFIDVGWSNPTGDLTDFDPRFFPNGPGEVVRRVTDMNMKLGLWTAPSSGPMAFHPDAFKPELASCGTLPPGDNSLTLFEAGVMREAGDEPQRHRGALCTAAEPYKSMFKRALLHHVTRNNVSGFKFDGVTSVCNNPCHGHMTGLYSIEALADALIDILEEVRTVCPDVFYMYYWNFRSPWWLLWGNTIYERGVLMEGSTASDAPTRHLRQSVTLSFDQATHHAWERVPLVSGDSLGVWISKWRWANYLGREEWRDAWIMDIARGSMMCQLWGDLSMFDDEDRQFLARVNAWIRDRADLLRNPARILGSPWDAEPYGYAYSENGRGIAFINNPTFETRAVDFALDETRVQAVLRPFELKVLELTEVGVLEFVPDPTANRDRSYTRLRSDLREISRETMRWSDPDEAHFIRRVVNGRAGYADLKEEYTPEDAERADSRDCNVVLRRFTGTVALPRMQTAGALLLICQTARDGIFWHHHALYDIIIPRLTVNGAVLETSSTPHRWHEEAGGWSWILFDAQVPAGGAGDAELEVSAYLPDGVDVSFVARLCSEQD